MSFDSFIGGCLRPLGALLIWTAFDLLSLDQHSIPEFQIPNFNLVLTAHRAFFIANLAMSLYTIAAEQAMAFHLALHWVEDCLMTYGTLNG
jgi:hypothetical protein